MSRSAVIGLGFGDEGKGVVTDFLCSRNPMKTMVTRFSGGHQAAHTVTVEKTEHIFSNFGSGTLRGCPTYWSSFCTFEPVGFCREYYRLVDRDKVIPKIFVDERCRVTTPYDIVANRTSPEREHGTTGTGFWRTIERNQRGLTFFVSELFKNGPTEIKMEQILEYYNMRFRQTAAEKEFYFAAGLISDMIKRGEVALVNRQPGSETVVFEGSQGLLLDKDLGFFPHVTPSKTNLTNALTIADKIDDVFLVTRAYQTRHGAGPMTNLSLPLNVIGEFERATAENEFQGALRKTVLDLDLLSYGVRDGIDGDCRRHGVRKNLVVTCLDQVEGPYRLTHDRTLREFNNAGEFVRYIAGALEIDGKTFGNFSPQSSTVREL